MNFIIIYRFHLKGIKIEKVDKPVANLYDKKE